MGYNGEMRTPYTYRISWSTTNVSYYGVRYSKNCHPSELFVTYFTSSSYVREYIKNNGMPDVIEIRKTFAENQVNEAREYEHRVLRRLRVATNPRWLNKTHNKSRPPLYGENNPATRPEVKEKIRETVKKTGVRGDNHPRRKNPEKWSHLSELFKGRDNWWSRGDLNVMRNKNKKSAIVEKMARGDNHYAYGKTWEDIYGEKATVYREETSKRFKGVPKKKVICPHCNKNGGTNAMGRWHFDNCKLKTS